MSDSARIALDQESPGPIASIAKQVANASASRPELEDNFAKTICSFREDCQKRYRFNSRCDNALNALGILLSIGIVTAGVYNVGKVTAILGAMVAAAVSAQRAFPFNQRATFYRNLIGQAQNVYAGYVFGGASITDSLTVMKNLQLDFSQQFPRGTSFKSEAEK